MHAPLVSTGISSSYRSDIDGLRAVAVLSVVVFHAFPDEKWLAGGFVGVDVFFVISGYLISKILFTEIEEHRFSLAAFYARRIRRIFPALAVCLAAVLAMVSSCWRLPNLLNSESRCSSGPASCQISRCGARSGYFVQCCHLKAAAASLVVGHRGAVLHPLAATALGGLQIKGSDWSADSRAVRGFFRSKYCAVSYRLSSRSYLPISRFWELLAGAALAWRGDIRLDRNFGNLASLAGLAAILTSAIIFTPEMRFPGWLALLPVAGSVAIILAGPGAVVNRTILSNRVAVSIGLVSYPLYLWHWPLISFSHVIRGKPPTLLMAAALVIASLLLAWLTFRFVEHPIRFGSNRRRRTLIIAAVVAALGACGLLVWTTGGVPQRFPANLDLQKISAATLDETYAPTKDMRVLEFNSCSGGSECLLGLRRGYALVSRIGQGDRKVALAGNSAMFHYGPRVQQLADEGRLAVEAYFVTSPGCYVAPGIVDRNEFVHCANLTNRLSELVRRERVQAVVLGSHYGSKKDALIERDGKSSCLT